MTTLRVVVDQLAARVPGGIGRYTRELTQQLIVTAPDGCEVEGIVSAHPDDTYEQLERMLPGLAHLYKAPIGRRELSRAWQYGLGIPLGGGMIHAPSLFAPLRRHDRVNDNEQIAVTIHDVVPWTHPETLTPHGVAWHKAMVKRARKHADAIVVPTHAVATQLAEYYDFGDRVRVIGGAVGSGLVLGAEADVRERSERLELPPEYILTVGTLEPRKGLASLIAGLALPGAPELPLLVVGPPGWGELDVLAVAEEEGLEDGRVRVLGFLSDADLAVVLSKATVFVYPSLAEGFGLPIIEAFNFGTPVVHSDDPALLEVSGGSGVAVERANQKEYPARLAEAIASVVGDTERSRRLSQYGIDRANAFSWRDSAERVWQLHADL
ncbi:glycosyltransferase family 4 protein [Glaciibacter superstes]|uniref:glycosyltransferase family 4 protein n=1 Tax=Glaciibacter superstes TaxID=501023 RepID=UPI0003B3A7FE|nr:glycosyltransferase family 1 protein [Glaciibacter superstes]